MARPLKKIDGNRVIELASWGVRVTEIAADAGCSKRTLERRFLREIKREHARLKVSLRIERLELALSGNVRMLICLGKEFLGQG